MENPDNAGDIAKTPTRSIWITIWHFPLVVLVLATAIIVGTAFVSAAVGQELIAPNFGENTAIIMGALLLVTLTFLVYKIGVVPLGAKKHDDLPTNRAALRDAALGFTGGAALISLCVALAALAGVYTISGPGGFTDWAFILFVTGLYAGFFEELLLRGIIFRWLEEFAGSWIALAISALVFGFGHAGNDNATLFSSLAIAIEAGILLGAAYMLTRSLWLAIGLHAGWNVVQALWGVPVSGNPVDGLVRAELEGPPLLAGGGFGLEATIFALVVATSAGVWMLWKAHKAGRVVPPMWSRKGAGITG